MKIRIGFVSNSSSQSFCIYGWTKDILKRHGLIDRIWEISDTEKAYLEDFYIDYDNAIGLGNYEGDLHPEEDDDSVTVDDPTNEQVATIDRLTEKYSLPAPEFMSGTFYNG